MQVENKLQSIRQAVGYSYVKPDIALLSKYQEALSESKEAQDYLRNEREFTDETIKHFNLGYNQAKDAIAIPVFKHGELIDFKYRMLNPTGPKYIRERESETWMFNDVGLIEAKKKGRILIVEGEFDAIACWQAGFTAVISPASGKDSYGVWLEQLDSIKKVYIAYDNDTGGIEASAKLAKRLGEEKCYIITYPTGTKDANEYFKEHTAKEFKTLASIARPFYQSKFNTLGDVINKLRNDTTTVVESSYLPDVKMRDGWMIMISGRSNVGKTSFVLNIAKELAEKHIPTLVLPFERGVESVGERFLHVLANKSPEDFSHMNDEEWDVLLKKTFDLDIYFALPEKNETLELIEQSKRILDTRVVIIDHLDYLVRSVGSGSREEAISNTLQTMKRIAEKAGIILIIVTHVRKVDGAGRTAQITRPGIEDMKGSSSLYQDPEAVVMLSETKNEREILVDVVKNKGEMGEQTFEFMRATGQFNTDYIQQEPAEPKNLWDPNDPAWG